MSITTLAKQLETCDTINTCIKLYEETIKDPKGEVETLKQDIIAASVEQKRVLGPRLKQLREEYKRALDTRIKEIQKMLETDTFIQYDPSISISSSLSPHPKHTLHPLTLVEKEVVDIFSKLGFDVYDGAHIQKQYYNFTSVGTPDYHPARGMQDTFFVDKYDENNEQYVMRTQVTANIVHYAKEVIAQADSLRVIFPGIVYRAETMDATHDINFHQVDFWMVDKSLTNSQMFDLLKHVLKEFFEDDTLQVRFRPSYFPFTQPSFEIDIFAKWFKGGAWIEVAGCGPIHKDVLTNMGLDHNEYTGLAAGFGLTRLAQLKLQISGLPQFYDGNIDFIQAR